MRKNKFNFFFTIYFYKVDLLENKNNREERKKGKERIDYNRKQ